MHSIWVISGLACSIMLTSNPAFASETPVLDRIHQESFAVLSAVETQDFEAVFTRSDGGVWNVRFVRDGSMHRIERDDLQSIIHDGAPLPQSFHIWAYNGKRYQLYNKETKILKLTNTRQALGAIDPLISPYKWLCGSQCRGLERENTRTPEIWKLAFAKAKFIREEQLFERSCYVVDFPHDCIPRPAVYRVWFLKDESCFPVRCDWKPVTSDKVGSTFEVKSFRSEIVDGKRLVLPLEMWFDQTGADGVSWKGTISTKVNPETAKLNQPVDHSLFTLNVPTKTIYDVDGQLELAKKADDAYEQFVQAPVDKQLQKWRRFLVILNIVFFGFLLIAIWRKKHV